MNRWKALKWIACCLMFRFYAVLPLGWQARLFNEIMGPVFFYLNKSLDVRPELRAALSIGEGE